MTEIVTFWFGNKRVRGTVVASRYDESGARFLTVETPTDRYSDVPAIHTDLTAGEAR